VWFVVNLLNVFVVVIIMSIKFFNVIITLTSYKTAEKSHNFASQMAKKAKLVLG
jgi:hypothetical protein